jgi:hypothetical protein
MLGEHSATESPPGLLFHGLKVVVLETLKSYMGLTHSLNRKCWSELTFLKTNKNLGLSGKKLLK